MWLVASIWIALALAASLVSIRLAITVSLMEIIFGILGGNLFGLHATPWTDAIGNFGIVLLSFLAGAEIDPDSLRQNLWQNLSIGLSSFLVPFVGVFLFTFYIGHWELKASVIAGLSLATTSVAIVYTTLLESGLMSTTDGKVTIAATLITDIVTMLVLGLFVIDAGIWLAIFAFVLILSFVALPRLMPWLHKKLGGRFGHPYIRTIVLIVFVLAGLFTQAGGQAVLPAFLAGIAMAGTLAKHKVEIERIQIITFTLLIPFYFLHAGMLLSLSDMILGFGWILIFLGLKMALKILAIFPLTRLFHWNIKEGFNTSLLMCTGLTFGTIAAMFGFTGGIIDRGQYTILLSAVIASALIPSFIAQALYPRKSPAEPSTDNSQ